MSRCSYCKRKIPETPTRCSKWTLSKFAANSWQHIYDRMWPSARGRLKESACDWTNRTSARIKTSRYWLTGCRTDDKQTQQPDVLPASGPLAAWDKTKMAFNRCSIVWMLWCLRLLCSTIRKYHSETFKREKYCSARCLISVRSNKHSADTWTLRRQWDGQDVQFYLSAFCAINKL